jgi:hypothetical protein
MTVERKPFQRHRRSFRRYVPGEAPGGLMARTLELQDGSAQAVVPAIKQGLRPRAFLNLAELIEAHRAS